MEKSLTPKEQRQVLWRLLSYMKTERKTAIVAFFLLITATTFELAGPYLVKIFIDDYLVPRRLAVRPLVLLAVIYFGTVVIKTIVTYFQLVKFQEIALRVIQTLRMDVFTKMHALGMRYFDQTPGGSIVSRVTNDTEAINRDVCGSASELCAKWGICVRDFCGDVFIGREACALLPFPASGYLVAHQNVPSL